jgi:hypothetical protein
MKPDSEREDILTSWKCFFGLRDSLAIFFNEIGNKIHSLFGEDGSSNGRILKYMELLFNKAERIERKNKDDLQLI